MIKVYYFKIILIYLLIIWFLLIVFKRIRFMVIYSEYFLKVWIFLIQRLDFSK